MSPVVLVDAPGADAAVVVVTLPGGTAAVV